MSLRIPETNMHRSHSSRQRNRVASVVVCFETRAHALDLSPCVSKKRVRSQFTEKGLKLQGEVSTAGDRGLRVDGTRAPKLVVYIVESQEDSQRIV